MAYSELTIFINQILDQKGLSGVDAAVREQLVTDMEKRLTDQINRGIIEAIPADKLVEFEKIASADNQDGNLEKFFSAYSVDTQTIATETMLRFKDLYLGTSK